jgi:hypothetical protein
MTTGVTAALTTSAANALFMPVKKSLPPRFEPFALCLRGVALDRQQCGLDCAALEKCARKLVDVVQHARRG